MPPAKTFQKPEAETIRRTVEMNADLASWVQWYATRSRQSILTVTDEAHRAYYEAHKDDFPNGPTVTSPPISEVLVDKRRAR